MSWWSSSVFGCCCGGVWSGGLAVALCARSLRMLGGAVVLAYSTTTRFQPSTIKSATTATSHKPPHNIQHIQ